MIQNATTDNRTRAESLEGYHTIRTLTLEQSRKLLYKQNKSKYKSAQEAHFMSLLNLRYIYYVFSKPCIKFRMFNISFTQNFYRNPKKNGLVLFF